MRKSYMNKIYKKFGFISDVKSLTAIEIEQSIKSLFYKLSITKEITDEEEIVIRKLINSLSTRLENINKLYIK
jgi:hypothetical protein